jgi:hypothetical protein
VNFVPSHHSLSQDYGGYFGKEERAARKKKRAKKLRKKAQKGGWLAKSRRKRASRKEILAGKLTTKKQIKPLPKNAEKLWKVEYPWGAREPMLAVTAASRILTPLAMGKKPLTRVRKAEHRATIYGAAQTLSMAGVPPYTSLGVDSFVFKAAGGKAEKNDKTLMKWAKEGAKAAGKKAPVGLKKAAEFMRKEAIGQNLEEAAWAGRALALLGPAARRAGISAGANAAASTGFAITASALAGASAAPPWIQAIATAPAAAISGLLGYVTGAKSAKAKIEGTQAKAHYEAFNQLLEQAYQNRSMADQALIVEEMEKQSKAKDREADVLIKEVGEAKKQAAEKAVSLLTYSIGAGVALMLTSYVIGKRRRA